MIRRAPRCLGKPPPPPARAGFGAPFGYGRREPPGDYDVLLVKDRLA